MWWDASDIFTIYLGAESTVHTLVEYVYCGPGSYGEGLRPALIMHCRIVGLEVGIFFVIKIIFGCVKAPPNFAFRHPALSSELPHLL